ncbi:hypothetical protein E4U42_007971 [Claviceps africana]|uniref:deuterolysin n=1 Tax=Claviceps africana TaxID=83212 RepID=A0A8K0NEW0_9HYPO|nr:hypothetical protein E4U42_007971 [Claviceps africana]
MKTGSLLFGALLCNAVTASFIPLLVRRPLQEQQTTETAPAQDNRIPSCLDGHVILSNSSVVGRRAVDSTCGAHQDLIDQAYADCAARARAGEQAARSGPSPLLRAIFKDDSEHVRMRIANHLGQIAKECDKNGQGSTRISCGPCDKGVAGLTVITKGAPHGTNPVTLCDSAIKPSPQEGCGRQDLGDVLLHELSHSWGETGDRGYGIQNILRLSSTDSLENADSYSHFCKAAKLQCDVNDLVPGAGGGAKGGPRGGGARGSSQPGPNSPRPGGKQSDAGQGSGASAQPGTTTIPLPGSATPAQPVPSHSSTPEPGHPEPGSTRGGSTAPSKGADPGSGSQNGSRPSQKPVPSSPASTANPGSHSPCPMGGHSGHATHPTPSTGPSPDKNRGHTPSPSPTDGPLFGPEGLTTGGAGDGPPSAGTYDDDDDDDDDDDSSPENSGTNTGTPPSGPNKPPSRVQDNPPPEQTGGKPSTHRDPNCHDSSPRQED